MGEEYLRVLQMVSEGKVSPEDAVGLLEALEPAPGSADKLPTSFAFAAPVPPAPPVPHVGPGMSHQTITVGLKHGSTAQRIRLYVHTAEGNEVNVCCPIGMSKRVAGLLPESAREALSDFGVDLDPFLAELGRDAPLGELVAVHTAEGGELKISLE